MIIDFTKSIFYVENYGFDVPTDAITLAYDELFTNCFLVYMDLLSKGSHKRIEYEKMAPTFLPLLLFINICVSKMVFITSHLILMLMKSIQSSKVFALTIVNTFIIKCGKK